METSSFSKGEQMSSYINFEKLAGTCGCFTMADDVCIVGQTPCAQDCPRSMLKEQLLSEEWPTQGALAQALMKAQVFTKAEIVLSIRTVYGITDKQAKNVISKAQTRLEKLGYTTIDQENFYVTKINKE